MIQTRLTILQPDGKTEERTADLPAHPGVDMLRSLLTPLFDGVVMEHVSVIHDGCRADMFVDGDAIDRGLPRNEAATAIYRYYSLSRTPARDAESLPAIYGTAILFHRRVWF